MLQHAVDSFGESREAVAASHTFGLLAGTKLKAATDRRRAAANAQGVSVERFRKGYEPQLIGQITDEIISLLARRGVGRVGSHESPSARTSTEKYLSLQNLHIADVLKDAHATADWHLAAGVYRQCIKIADDDDTIVIPDAVLSFLAEAIDRVSVHYFGKEKEFVLHALAVFGDVEKAERISQSLFHRLYEDNRFDRFTQYAVGPSSTMKKRRPRPFEAIVETARRLGDVCSIRRTLEDLPVYVTLGGSASYGRFLYVRGHAGHTAGSDVDLIFVVPHYDALNEVVERLVNFHDADDSSVQSLVRRANVFKNENLDDSRTIFSHKIPIKDNEPNSIMTWASNRGSYILDLRIMSVAVLDWLLVDDSTTLTASSSGHSRLIRDYSEHGSYTESNYRSFSGRNIRSGIDETEVDAGFLRTSRAYLIDDEDRYYPGMHQNLFLPLSARHWGNLSITDKLDAFRWKIVERLRYERRLQPYELLKISLSHANSENFVPHVLRSVDSRDNS